MANRSPHFTSPAGGTGRDDTLRRAMLALQSQNPREAERIASEILKADPRHARTLYLLGSALLMQGRAKDAISPLETAVRGRQDSEIETELAIALRTTGRIDDAVRRLKRIVKREPPFAAAFVELGSLLASMAQYDEATEVLIRGIAIAPMMPRLSVELGNVFLHRRKCADAERAFTRALALSPDAPAALFGMAKVHQEVGNGEAALPYFRRYLIARPQDAGAWLTFGHCLLEVGRRDEGYECFRTAARGAPERYGHALNSLVASGRGRFWLKESAAAKYFGVPGAGI